MNDETALAYRTLCETGELGYSSYMRWKRRDRLNEPLVNRAGPKKIGSLNLGSLRGKIDGLNHVNKRTHGTKNLYDQVKQWISRRDFWAMVDLSRRDAVLERRSQQRRIQWNAPGIAWSMDDSELMRDADGIRTSFHNVQDLASGYKIQPIVGTSLCGEEIAGHTDHLFRQFGAPLFFKRDNGGNLNHSTVDEVFAEYGVIPLNSPTYYAPYNGAIERGQRELKEGLAEKEPDWRSRTTSELESLVEIVAHDANHQHRRSLDGWNSCQIFFEGKERNRFSKRRRQEIFDELMEMSSGIIQAMDDPRQDDRDAAWRIVCEKWLVQNGYISVFRESDVLPYFSPERSHN